MIVTVRGDIQTTNGIHPSTQWFEREGMTPEQAIQDVITEICYFQGVRMYVTGPIFECEGVTKIYGG